MPRNRDRVIALREHALRRRPAFAFRNHVHAPSGAEARLETVALRRGCRGALFERRERLGLATDLDHAFRGSNDRPQEIRLPVSRGERRTHTATASWELRAI